MSDSLWPHGLLHSRLSCPSLSPGVCSDSCPLSWWFHPTISSFVSPSLQSFPASGSFPMSRLLHIRWPKYWSFSFSISPSNIQGWFPFRLTGWISLLSKDTQESSPAPQFKSISSSVFNLFYGPTLTSIISPLEKPDLWLNGLLLAK